MSPTDSETRSGTKRGHWKKVVNAWIDIERLQPFEIEKKLDDWEHVGRIPYGEKVIPPTSPKCDKEENKCLVNTVLVNAIKVEDLETALAELLDDEKMKAVGFATRRNRAKDVRTCRAFFRLTSSGLPQHGSLKFCPMPDFVRSLRSARRHKVGIDDAIGIALDRTKTIEESLTRRFDHLAERLAETDETDPVDAIDAVREATKLVAGNKGAWNWCSSGVEHWYRSRCVKRGTDFDEQLTSFFETDLLKAVNGQLQDGALKSYLQADSSMRAPTAQEVTSQDNLTHLLSPERLPLATWPSGKRLRLSQQVALSAALTQADSSHVIAVNGPPGTGKTTLLRDVFANLVVQRATRMIAYADPADAFRRIATIPDGEYNWTIQAIAEDLTGFEMLLTSANNEALENVTAELPLAKQDLSEPLSYFATQANWTPDKATELQKQWGFATGILGNRKNVDSFLGRLGKFTSSNNKDGRPLAPSLLNSLLVVPPRESWDVACANFRRAHEEVLNLIAERVDALRVVPQCDQLVAQSDRARLVTDESAVALQKARDALERTESALTDVRSTVKDAETLLQEVEDEKPWFPKSLIPLYRTPWKERKNAANSVLKGAKERLESAEDSLRLATQEWDRRQNANTHAQKAFNKAARNADYARQLSDTWKGRLIDAQWVQDITVQKELDGAWHDDALVRAQGRLFVSALEVHEAFAQGAGPLIRKNLYVWAKLINGEFERRPGPAVARAVWQTIFLVVPMLSSTFASVARLLQDIDQPTIGWLIVDEAGQAAPQMAVGALARSKRAVVVGDPAQLEPVVPLPERLIVKLMERRRASTKYAPNVASVQTLADGSGIYGHLRGDIWIGLPLRAHQRCISPMFNISNDLAYEGYMIQGRTSPPCAAAELLGESRWIDVPHEGDSHWELGDWEAIAELFSGIELSSAFDVALLTPFRDVSRELSERRNQLLPAAARRADADAKNKLAKVGTIHTFQGQERNIVVLVLGGGRQRKGAVKWATAKPNLLNVAVSRAKDRLFVVGDRELWTEFENGRKVYEGLHTSSSF